MAIDPRFTQENTFAGRQHERLFGGGTPGSSSSSILSALTELNPTGEVTRAELPDIGEFTPPVPDLARIRQLTQEELAPDTRRLRSTVADAIGRAMQTGEAHKSGSLIREIIGGFGQATENLARGARGRAQDIARGEFAPVADAARLGFLESSRRATANFEADLKREMMEREATMKDELIETSLANFRRAPATTVSRPTFNPFGSVATTPGRRTQAARFGGGGGGPSKTFTGGAASGFSGGGAGSEGFANISPEEEEIISSLPVNVLQPAKVGPSQSFPKRFTPRAGTPFDELPFSFSSMGGV